MSLIFLDRQGTSPGGCSVGWDTSLEDPGPFLHAQHHAQEVELVKVRSPLNLGPLKLGKCTLSLHRFVDYPLSVPAGYSLQPQLSFLANWFFLSLQFSGQNFVL